MSDGTYNARGDTHLCMDGVSSWPIADSVEVAIAKTNVIRQLRGHRRHFELNATAVIARTLRPVTILPVSAIYFLKCSVLRCAVKAASLS